MPRPQQWYEEFKKIASNSEQLKGKEGSFYLRTPDDKFIFEPKDMFGGMDLMNLNEQQVETLYNAVQNNGVLIANKNGDKAFKALYNNKAGNCKSTTSFNAMGDEEYPDVIKAALEKYSQIPENMIVKEEKVQGLNQMVKTVTDMYSGNSVDDLVGVEWILDKHGMPIQKTDNPWDHYEKIYNASNLEEGVYLQNVPNKQGPEENTFKLAKENNQYTKVKQDKVMIKPQVKSKAILELGNVYDALNSMKTKNPQLLKLKNSCSDVIHDLSKATDLKEFKKVLRDFTKEADQYFLDKGGAQLSKGKLGKLGVVNNIRKIRDAVEQDKVFEKKEEDKLLDAQQRIAGKFVKAYSLNAAKKGTPEEKKEASEILTNPEKFQEKINKTMGTAAFQFLYGTQAGESPEDALKRLNALANQKPSKIAGAMNKEIKDPTPARLELEKFMKEKAPSRFAGERDYKPTSPETIKSAREFVGNASRALEGLGPSNSSPQFAAVSHQLKVLQIRLKDPSPYMDISNDLAALGNYVDEYLTKKTGQKTLNDNEIKKISVLTNLGNNCEATLNGTKPKEPLSPADMEKDLLATRLTNETIKQMTESKDPKVQRMGKEIELDRNAFEKEKNNIMNSASFNELYGKPEAVHAALGTKISKVYSQLTSKTSELAKKEQAAVEKVNNVEQKNKEQEKKIIKDQGPSVGGM